MKLFKTASHPLSFAKALQQENSFNELILSLTFFQDIIQFKRKIKIPLLHECNAQCANIESQASMIENPMTYYDLLTQYLGHFEI